MRLRRKRRRCLPSHSRRGLARSLARPWSLSRGLLPTIRRVTRPWLRAPRQGRLHRRRPRGASARPSPAPQPRCCPSASARASSRMQPSWAMVKTSMNRATRTATTTRDTATRTRTGSRTAGTSRTRMLAPAVVSPGLVPTSRGRVPSRAIQAAPARDLLRRAAEAPVAPAVGVRSRSSDTVLTFSQTGAHGTARPSSHEQQDRMSSRSC